MWSNTERLGWYIRDLIDNGSFTGSAWLQHGNSLKTMLTSAALEDVYRTYDYGFDDDAFLEQSHHGDGAAMCRKASPHT